jgi:hypothetical protein
MVICSVKAIRRAFFIARTAKNLCRASRVASARKKKCHYKKLFNL